MDLKTALTEIRLNSQDIAVIKVELCNKVSKVDCVKCVHAQ